MEAQRRCTGRLTPGTKYRFAACLGLVTIAACGLTNTPDPNVLHVANVSYSDTACGPASCSGILKFRLLNSANAGSYGMVVIDSHGMQPIIAIWTHADGWRQLAWIVEQPSRPYTITICPVGVSEGNSRCARGTTG